MAKDWTEQHVREVLAAKVGRMLESVIESSVEVGAWILPDCPRRRNAAAQMVCEAFPNSSNCVAMAIVAHSFCCEMLNAQKHGWEGKRLEFQCQQHNDC